MRMLKQGILVCVLCFFGFQVTAQKVLTLEGCLDIAMENNIDLKRAHNNALIAKSNQLQAMMGFLPSLEARTNYDFFFGTFFDTNAARQVSSTTRSSNPNVRTNLTLFNGMANHHRVKARWHDNQAAENSIEEQKLNVRATILGAYLNVVLDKENIKISEKRMALLEAQLDREIKRESVGVGNLEQVYNFKSQLANEKLNQVNLTNRLKSDRLLLLQALGIKDTNGYEVEAYDFQEMELTQPVGTYEDILETSLAYSPSIKRAKSENLASSYSLKIARASYLPTISAFGLFGSNYSSNGALNPETGAFEPNAGFFDQLAFNEFKYFNISLSIPIFSNWRNKNQVQVAKINLLNSELDLKQAELTMNNAVQQVYLDLVAAHSTYQAAEENLIALNQSFEFVSTRYEQGNTDFFTYLESLNNKNRAEIELINAKYSIVFRKKILDVYKGIY